MDARIERINKDIEKAKEKISEFQGKVKELEQRKTELENTNILAVVRTANITPQELIAFIQAHKAQGAAAETMLETRITQEDYENEEV